MNNAQRLLRAFEGSKAAYGETTVGRIGRGGKAEAKSFIRRGAMTEEMVQAHIDGKQGIGAIPITADNVCKFGALDIDTYDLDLSALNQKVRQMELPLFLCRSKSGGAHLFLFLDEWLPASLVREYLTEMSIALGFSGCEIFPKQDQILADRGDLGNFINMPYHNADITTRYCLDAKGDALELEEFLTLVEKNRVSRAMLDTLDLGGSSEHFTDGPPCLRMIVRLGRNSVGEMRNVTLYQMGVYAKSKYPDTWEDVIDEYNRMFFVEPLPSSEVLNIIKQLRKKNYYYTCGIEPFKSVCDKTLCRTAPHGVGGDPESKADFGGLQVIMSDPPYYILTINAKPVELNIDSLHNQSLFQKACLGQISFMPEALKARDWTSLVNGLLKEATYSEAPPELTRSGRFRELLRMYCNGMAQAHEPEELETGKPWTSDGKTKFKFEGLMTFLKNNQFTDFERPKILKELEDLNGGGEFSGHQNIRRRDGGRSTIRVYWVPEFVEDDVDLNATPLEDDVPF